MTAWHGPRCLPRPRSPFRSLHQARRDSRLHWGLIHRYSGRDEMASLCAAWVPLAVVLALGTAGCSVPLAYRPRQPARGVADGVSAEVRNVELGETQGVIILSVTAPRGGKLGDATLIALPAPPCVAGPVPAARPDRASVTAVVVDQQESYLSGPADLSGTAHEVALTFVATDKLWRRDHLAIDLALTNPGSSISGCLRLELTGINGADWEGSR